jgi:hypothetical protein
MCPFLEQWLCLAFQLLRGVLEFFQYNVFNVGGGMGNIIWVICLDDELINNHEYWVIASNYDSESEALAETSLDYTELYRERREFFHDELLKSAEYAVEDMMVPGAVYKLTRKEDSV